MTEDTRDNSDCDWPTVDGVQPFDKMHPGEIDKIFQASCPKCDGRVWIFVLRSPYRGTPEVEYDARACQTCGYIHWLRGPNTSEIIPLPAAASPAKKDRVRALVHSMFGSPSAYLFFGKFDGSQYNLGVPEEVIEYVSKLDREIEATK